MKIIQLAIFFVLTTTFFCCTNSDKHYFNGDIVQINEENVIEKNITSKFISLDDTPTGMMMAAYDSLLICWSPEMANNFFNIFNIDTGRKLGSFCEKGRGSKEAISVGCIFQLFKKGNDLMTLLYATNERKLFEWNITKSVEKGRTVYDTILPYDTYSTHWHFNQSEDMAFDYQSSNKLGKNEVSTPYYKKRNIYTNKLVQDYPIYKTKSIRSTAIRPLYTFDAIKPDGSKIVQVMRHLPQINILDTYTGNLVGYRMKNGPNFSLLETDLESANIYYNSVHADDNYIYATYWGKELWDNTRFPDLHTIHIFDWDGNLLYKLTTDQSYFNVWSDPVRKRLYTLDMNTEKICYFDLILN